MDEATKIQKLQAFVDPIKSQWQDERLTSALSDYSGFCRMMAMDRAQEYLSKRQVHKVQDWGSVELDDEGKLLQEELEKAQVVRCLNAWLHGGHVHAVLTFIAALAVETDKVILDLLGR